MKQGMGGAVRTVPDSTVGGRHLAEIATDVRLALRSLRSTPGFTLVTGLTLALGIAGASTMFAVVDGVLVQSLPYPDGERLVHVIQSGEGGSLDPAIQNLALSYPNLEDLRAGSDALEGLAAWQGWSFVQEGADGVRVRHTGGRVSPDFFRVLGVEPTLGRFFTADEPEGAVVVSHGYWQEELGGDPDMIGRSMSFGGRPHTVVGVAAPDFVDPVAALVARQFDLVPPAAWRLTRFDLGPLDRANLDVWSVGRLREGASLDRGRGDMARISTALREAHPDANRNRTFSLVTVHEALVGGTRPTLLALFGAVGVLLLIASTNVANLFLTRGTLKRGELAVRTALGAQRGRLLRQMVTEACVFSLLAGGFGLVLCRLGMAALRPVAREWLPRADQVALDLRVVGFTMLVSVVTALVFGLAPVLQATGRWDLAGVLRGERGGSSRSGERLRAGFAATQVAMALVLLAGMGLVLKSFLNLSSEETGIDVEGVTTLEVALDASVYDTPVEQNVVVAAIEAELGRLSGVVEVGMVNALPMSGQIDATAIVREEDHARLASEIDALPRFPVRTARAGYFEAMGIPFRGGRSFGPVDAAEGERVAIVNEALARHLYPGSDPVGRRVVVRGVTLEIVGVVGDVRHFGPARPVEPALYTLYDQEASEWMRRSITFVLRSREPTAPAEGELRASVASAGPALTVTRVRPMGELLGNHLAEPRFRVVVAALFAGLAFVLAVVGVGAVAAFGVTRSVREYAIRTACGAGPERIAGAVLKRTLRFVAIGIALGLAGAIASGALVEGLLHEVSPADPAVLGGVTLLLTAAALLAAVPPAWRALRADPALLLRED